MFVCFTAAYDGQPAELLATLPGIEPSGHGTGAARPGAGGRKRRFGALFAAAVAVWLAGCGYHVAGRADLVPKHINTIAIPAFGNVSTRYQLSNRLPRDIAREFITRTRYQIVHEENEADAVLRGSVVNFNSFPTVFDPVSGRASAVQVNVTLEIRLLERSTGSVIFERPRMEVRENYEIAIDQSAFFEEEGPALARLSQSVAREIVSAVLENF